jgi:hypothetical protein
MSAAGQSKIDISEPSDVTIGWSNVCNVVRIGPVPQFGIVRPVGPRSGPPTHRSRPGPQRLRVSPEGLSTVLFASTRRTSCPIAYADHPDAEGLNAP